MSNTARDNATDAVTDSSWDECATPERQPCMEQTPLPKVIVPKRKIIIEPVLMLFAISNFPVGLLSQTFIYNQMFTENAAREGLNITPHDLNQSSPCSVNQSDPLYKFREKVQSDSAYFSLMLSIAESIPALFVTIFIGAYSDKAGRRYAIIPPLIGSLLGNLGYLLVVCLDLDVKYLLFGSFLNGFGGRYTTLLMGCFAYIADITTPEKRMFRITVVEMSMFFSAILTPIGAAKLITSLGYFYAFLIVMIGQTLTMLYAIFFVPETIRRDPDAKFFTLQPVRGTLELFKQDNGTDRRWQLCLLMLSFLFSCVPFFDMPLITLFELNTPLCWDVMMIGYYSTVYIGVASVGAIVAARLLKCCIADQSIALIAGIACVLKQVYVAFVQNIWMMFLCPLFGIFSVLYIPSIRTLMSKLVGEHEQGAVFGAIACAEVACSLLGSIIFNPIYVNTLNIMTGFVFLIMAIFYFTGCVIYSLYLIRLRQTRRLKSCDELLVNDTDEPDGF